MPHLSPMSWILAPIMFCLIFVPLLISSLWWSQTPSFPISAPSSSQSTFNSWNWN